MHNDSFNMIIYSEFDPQEEIGPYRERSEAQLIRYHLSSKDSSRTIQTFGSSIDIQAIEEVIVL